MKFLAARLTRDRSAVDRFTREARAASALNHPNIVTIHEIGEGAAGQFIAMELVQGRSLRQLVRERVPVVLGFRDRGSDLCRAARSRAATRLAGS